MTGQMANSKNYDNANEGKQQTVDIPTELKSFKEKERNLMERAEEIINLRKSLLHVSAQADEQAKELGEIIYVIDKELRRVDASKNIEHDESFASALINNTLKSLSAKKDVSLSVRLFVQALWKYEDIAKEKHDDEALHPYGKVDVVARMRVLTDLFNKKVFPSDQLLRKTMHETANTSEEKSPGPK